MGHKMSLLSTWKVLTEKVLSELSKCGVQSIPGEKLNLTKHSTLFET